MKKTKKLTYNAEYINPYYYIIKLTLKIDLLLQKWERENANLPTHLQKKPPIKPDDNLTPEEWNQSAWQASQVSRN